MFQFLKVWFDERGPSKALGGFTCSLVFGIHASLSLSLSLSLVLLVIGTLIVSVGGELAALTPSDGLVGSWAFEGNVADSTTNANNGALNGGAVIGTGQTGQGLVLSGTGNSHVAIANSASLNTATTALTVSSWIKPTATPSGLAVVASRQFGTATNDQFAFGLSGTTLALYLNTANGGNQGFFGPSITIGQWSHIAFTYDGANIRFFVNGLLAATQARTGTIAVTDKPLLIGGGANTSTANTAEELFVGTIDTACIHNRALGSAEIATQNTCPVGGAGTTTTTSPVTTTTTLSPATTTAATTTSLTPTTTTTSATTTTTTSVPQVSGSGLVGSWAFEGNVADLTANANNGQLNGGAVFGAGKNGQGVVLNGTGNSHVAIPNSASLNTITTQMSVSGWVKPTTNSAFTAIVARQLGTGSNDQFVLGTQGGNLQIYFNTTANGTQGHTGGPVPVGQWTHIAATYDGSNLRLYTNGTQTGIQGRSGTIVVSDRPLLIGGGANTSTANTAEELFNGSIDTVCVHSRALTAAEVATQNTCSTTTPVTTTTTTSPAATSTTSPATTSTSTSTTSPATTTTTTTASASTTTSSTTTRPASTTTSTSTTIAAAPGQTVFTDSYVNGWSATAGHSIQATGGNPGAFLNRTSTPAYEGIGFSTGSPAGAFTTMSFDLKSTVPIALAIYADSGGTQPIGRQAPASATWTRYTCAFPALQTAWPWMGFKLYNVANPGDISVDNIQLGFGTQPINTCQAGGPTGGTTTTTTTAPAATTTSTTTTNPAATTTTSSTTTTTIAGGGSAAGPVGEWHFEGGMTDATSSANNGQLFGSAALTPGKSGSGLSVNGTSNGHAAAPNSPSLNSVSSALSVSAWIKPTAVAGFNPVASRQLGTGANEQFALGLSGGNLHLYFNTTNGGNQALAGPAVAVGQWSHVAATYDGSNVRLFLNGVQVAIQVRTGTIAVSDRAFTVGGNANSGTTNTADELFNGIIDDVCLFNRALTTNEVATQSTCPLGGIVTPPVEGTPGTPPVIGVQATTRAGRGASLTKIDVPYSPVSATVPEVDRIRNKNSGKCLSIINSSTVEGTFANQWDCYSAANQRWTLIPVVGTDLVQIRSTATSQCLSLDGNDPLGLQGDGVHFLQWGCIAAHPNQSFRVEARGDGAYNLVLNASNKCLGVDYSVTANTSTPSINQWACIPGSSAQGWLIDSFGPNGIKPVVDVPSDVYQRDQSSGYTASMFGGQGAISQAVNVTGYKNMFFYGGNQAPLPYPGAGHQWRWGNGSERWIAGGNFDLSTVNLGSGQPIQRVTMSMSGTCETQTQAPWTNYFGWSPGAPVNVELIRHPNVTAQNLTANDHYQGDPAANGNAKWAYVSSSFVDGASSVVIDITDWASSILLAPNPRPVQSFSMLLYNPTASFEGLRCNFPTPTINVTLSAPPKSVSPVSPADGFLTTNRPVLQVGTSIPHDATYPAVKYQFNVCRNRAMTEDCRFLPSTGPTLVMPADGPDALYWNTTYFWNVTLTYNSTLPAFSTLKTNTVPSAFNTTSKDFDIGANTTLASEMAAAGWNPFSGYDGIDNGDFGVNTGTGALTHSDTDATIATAGPGLAITRTYNSNDQRVGLFGKGWSSVFDAGIQLTPSWVTNPSQAQGAIVFYPDGRREFHGRNPTVNGVTTWGDQKGFNARLRVVDPSLASSPLELTLRNGTVLKFAQTSTQSKYTIAQISDANTRVVQFSISGNTMRMTDSLSQRALWANVTAGRINSVDLMRGNAVDSTWTYQYTGTNLTKVCNPDTSASPGCAGTTLGYTNDKLTSLARPKGNAALTVEYNADGSVKNRTDSGVYTSYTYQKDVDGDPYRTTIQLPTLAGTTPEQRVRIDVYDSDRRLVRSQRPGQVNRSERRAYDTGGFLAFIENELGERTSFQNDSRGNVRKSWDPLNRETTFEYTSGSSPDLLTKRIRPSGLYEEWVYDGYRNMTQSRDTTGLLTTNSFNVSNFNVLTATTQPGVGTTTFTYTSPERDLLTETSPRGHVKTFAYDGVGRLKRSDSGIASDAMRFGTSTVDIYDSSGRIKQTTGPLVANAVTGQVTKLQTVFTYDLNGNLLTSTATTIAVSGTGATHAVRKLTYEHDSFDRVASSTVVGVGTSTTSYNRAGGVHRQTDTAGRTTSNTKYLPSGQPKRIEVASSESVPFDFLFDTDGPKWEALYPNPAIIRLVSEITESDALDRPTRVVDLRGRETVMRYGADGQVGRTDRLSGGVSVLVSQAEFDVDGRVTKTYGDDGLTNIQNSYDPTNGRLVSVKQVLGTGDANSAADRTTSFTYVASGDGAGQIDTTTDSLGQVTNFDYGAGGVVTSVTAPGGLVTSTGYDERGLKTQMTDETGATSSAEYDVLGQLVKRISPAVAVNGAGLVQPVTFTGYNPFGQVTESKDERGNITRNEIDAVGRVTRVLYPTYTQPRSGVVLNPTEEFTYTLRGQVLASKSRYGAITSYEYEPFGDRVSKMIAPSGQVDTYTYDDVVGSTSQATGDGSGFVLTSSSSSSDPLGRNRSQNNGGRVSSSTFDGAGRMITSTAPDGTVSRSAYNRAGELVEMTGADGTAVVTNWMDAGGRVTASTDALGRRSDTAYRADQKVGSQMQVSPSGVAMEGATYTYDIAGRVTTMTNLGGQVTSSKSDALGRVMTSWANPTASVSTVIATSYGYDLSGNLTRLTDGRGKVTEYGFNSWGSAESTVESGAEPVLDRTWTTEYNVGGAPVKDFEPGGVVVARTFNANLGVLETVNGTGGVDAPSATKSFTYDGFGRMTGYSTPTGVRSTEYDQFGQLTKVRNGSSVESEFSYDSMGRMTSRSDSAGQTSFGWTNTGLLASAAMAGKGRTDYTWQGAELRTIEYASNSAPAITPVLVTAPTTTPTVTTTAPTTTVATATTTTVAGSTTTLAPRGTAPQAPGVGPSVPRGPAPQAAVYAHRNFSYDGIGRLEHDVLSSFTGGVVPLMSQSYTYDNTGNVVSQTVGLNRSPRTFRQPASGPPVTPTYDWVTNTDTYTYDLADRLVGWTNPTGTNTTYTYDAAANRVSAAGVSFVYNDRNELVSSSDGTSYSFSKRGSLVGTTKAGVTTGQTTDALGRVVQAGPVAFAYDGWDRVSSRTENLSSRSFSYGGLEMDPSSDGTSSYHRTPSGGSLAISTGAGTSFTGTNRHGDVTQLVTPSGAESTLTGRQSFDPFGQALTPALVSVGFQGDWTDPTSKQAWMGARWYQAGTATFTTRDTFSGSVGQNGSHNRHTYGLNNPTRFWDPTGWMIEDLSSPCVGMDENELVRETCSNKEANEYGLKGISQPLLEPTIRELEKTRGKQIYENANWSMLLWGLAGVSKTDLHSKDYKQRMKALASIYDWYGRQAMKMPTVHWWGLAKYAGSQVYANIENIELVRSGGASASGLIPNQIARTFGAAALNDLLGGVSATLIEGAEAIFDNLGSMGLAFEFGGLGGVQSWIGRQYPGTKNSGIRTTLQGAWADAASTDVNRQWKAADTLTAHEQGNDVLQPVFDKLLNQVGVLREPTQIIIGLLASCPWGNVGCNRYATSIDDVMEWRCVKTVVCSFRSKNPYTDFTNRMAWIRGDIVPGYRNLKANNYGTYVADMNVPTALLAQRYRIPS